MAEPSPPSFPALPQRFFAEHPTKHRAVSARTIAAYRDTFRLLPRFAERYIGRPPAAVTMTDLNAKLILAFLDHLEKSGNNSVRSRNARLAALRSFLKYAAHRDISVPQAIEQALAIPMKRFDRPMLASFPARRCKPSLKRRIAKAGPARGTRHSSPCSTTLARGSRR